MTFGAVMAVMSTVVVMVMMTTTVSVFAIAIVVSAPVPVVSISVMARFGRFESEFASFRAAVFVR